MATIKLTTNSTLKVKETYADIRGKLSSSFNWIELTEIGTSVFEKDSTIDKETKVMVNKSQIVMFE